MRGGIQVYGLRDYGVGVIITSICYNVGHPHVTRRRVTMDSTYRRLRLIIFYVRVAGHVGGTKVSIVGLLFMIIRLVGRFVMNVFALLYTHFYTTTGFTSYRVIYFGLLKDIAI